MNSHVAWHDIRADHVERAGGETAVDTGKRQILAETVGHRLAEVRRARGLTQQQVADRMGVTKGRVSPSRPSPELSRRRDPQVSAAHHRGAMVRLALRTPTAIQPPHRTCLDAVR
ncbi:MAG: helix-turn-helix domain-containing protein [Pseudonocardia sp.]|nr:helix-turn-helix domain-containing protein [Pseudonocardia sp.]